MGERTARREGRRGRTAHVLAVSEDGQVSATVVVREGSDVHLGGREVVELVERLVDGREHVWRG